MSPKGAKPHLPHLRAGGVGHGDRRAQMVRMDEVDVLHHVVRRKDRGILRLHGLQHREVGYHKPQREQKEPVPRRAPVVLHLHQADHDHDGEEAKKGVQRRRERGEFYFYARATIAAVRAGRPPKPNNN